MRTTSFYYYGTKRYSGVVDKSVSYHVAQHNVDSWALTTTSITVWSSCSVMMSPLSYFGALFRTPSLCVMGQPMSTCCRISSRKREQTMLSLHPYNRFFAWFTFPNHSEWVTIRRSTLDLKTCANTINISVCQISYSSEMRWQNYSLFYTGKFSGSFWECWNSRMVIMKLKLIGYNLHGQAN